MSEYKLGKEEMLMVNFGFNVLLLLAITNVANQLRGKLNIKRELEELKAIFD
jgi:hypothetical protein|tara:strand:- start:1073 stop:1228 length:156 start_codon:yes stop_codon:yes gene_type:complete